MVPFRHNRNIQGCDHAVASPGARPQPRPGLAHPTLAAWLALAAGIASAQPDYRLVTFDDLTRCTAIGSRAYGYAPDRNGLPHPGSVALARSANVRLAFQVTLPRDLPPEAFRGLLGYMRINKAINKAVRRAELMGVQDFALTLDYERLEGSDRDAYAYAVTRAATMIERRYTRPVSLFGLSLGRFSWDECVRMLSGFDGMGSNGHQFKPGEWYDISGDAQEALAQGKGCTPYVWYRDRSHNMVPYLHLADQARDYRAKGATGFIIRAEIDDERVAEGVQRCLDAFAESNTGVSK